LLPLNWQRVSSSEDNSVLLILCISAGELNHLPALFTCHLNDEANGPLAKQLRRVCHDTLDFIQVPGFPSAIRLFALTHSRRIVVQR
jgi:hypothetical protein